MDLVAGIGAKVDGVSQTLGKTQTDFGQQIVFPVRVRVAFTCLCQASHCIRCEVRVAVEKLQAVHADAALLVILAIQAQVLSAEFNVPFVIQDLTDR